MAFVCKLSDPERWTERLITQPLRSDIIVQMGYDARIPATYYSTIHMYWNKHEEIMEFAFGFLGVDNGTGKRVHIYKGDIVAKIVPPECRAKMRPLLGHHAQRIVQSVKPSTFLMETFDANLRTEALEKYGPLCDIFSALGYAVVASVAPSGKNRWVMSR